MEFCLMLFTFNFFNGYILKVQSPDIEDHTYRITFIIFKIDALYNFKSLLKTIFF